MGDGKGKGEEGRSRRRRRIIFGTSKVGKRIIFGIQLFSKVMEALQDVHATVLKMLRNRFAHCCYIFAPLSTC